MGGLLNVEALWSCGMGMKVTMGDALITCRECVLSPLSHSLEVACCLGCKAVVHIVMQVYMSSVAKTVSRHPKSKPYCTVIFSLSISLKPHFLWIAALISFFSHLKPFQNEI